MENTSHWDYAESFSGRDAACLIGGFDPSIYSAEGEYQIQPIIARMKKAYYGTVRRMIDEITRGAGFYIDESKDEFAEINALRHRSPNSGGAFNDIPELWSADVERMICDYNDKYSESGIPPDYDFTYSDKQNLPAAEAKARVRKWRNDDAGQSEKYRDLEWEIRTVLFHWAYDMMHEFGDQRFTRSELHRWISDNKLPSKYRFSRPQSENADEKPLTSTERNSLLVMIAALCRRADLDITGPKTVGEIVRLIDELGANLGDDTIRSTLRKIPDAIGARSKK